MGIKNIKNLIKKYASESITCVHLSNYRLKKIAIDVSLYVFRAKARANSKGAPSQWILDFIYIISSFRKYNIHPVFIYDSTAPQEKDQTKKERASRKQSTRDKVKHLSSLLENYYRSGEPCDELKQMVDSRDQLLLGDDEKIFDVQTIVDKVEKLKSQIIDVSTEDFILTQTLLDILNVPYIYASSEAEKTASFLCKSGVVDAVLTEDSDVLAYGCNIFLYNIDTVNNTVMEINFDKVLELMGLSRESFLDLCILCGSDYNSNLKGIGPEKSYQLIQKYSSIDNIAESLDITSLNHTKVRSLFNDFSSEPNLVFKYTGQPDIEALTSFLSENSLGFNISTVIKSFSYEEVNFE